MNEMICPECNQYTLDYDSYFRRFVCRNRECNASELSSEKIKQIARQDAIKGTCNVCQGNIVKYRNDNILHCETCGLMYYRLPEVKK